MGKYDKNIYDQLGEREANLLYAIYNHRCLTTEQIFRLFYDSKDKEIGDTYCKRKINFLVKNKFIEKIKHNNTYIYYIESIGINYIKKKFSIPTSIYNLDKNNEERSYFRASELRIKPKNIPHQLALNEFVIDFKQNVPNDIDYSYCDEKYLTEYEDIRPDGLLEINNHKYFLEIDMGTETTKQLIEKWVHYRRFFKSNNIALDKQNLTILFIVEKADNLVSRIDLIKKSIFTEILDDVKNEIEIFVGTHEEMLDVIYKRIDIENKEEKNIAVLLKKKNFKLYSTSGLENITYHKFKYYIKSETTYKEYFVDSFLDEPLSVYNKITYFPKIEMYFKNKFNRDIGYIIVVSSEEQALRMLKLLEINQIQNIYFTTIEKLKNNSFGKALFQLSLHGDCYFFNDDNLQTRQFEKSL